MNEKEHSHDALSKSAPSQDRVGPTVKDPVCGMHVDPLTAAGSYEHGGQNYFFCSPHCLSKFRADPAKYLVQSEDHVLHECPAQEAASQPEANGE